MHILKGKKIVLCVTGSVAAVECPKLAREMRRCGAAVFCVMSESATRIISPDVLEWASGNRVVTKLTGKVEHVKLAGETPEKADAVVVAPCTANTLGKIAAGIDDTPPTTLVATAIGSGIPLLVVPAMHASMYRHPVVKENIKKLERLGVSVLSPKREEGKAKFPGLETVAGAIAAQCTEKDLTGKKILVTAGPTREQIDGVRFISNRSSGKMGVWLAEEAAARGAKVALIRGPTYISPNGSVRDTRVESASEMLKAVEENLDVDAVVHAAAVSDYTAKKKPGKFSSRKGITLCLQPTQKILEKIKKLNENVFLVGFKAECNVSKKQLVERAFKKLRAANADLVVANEVGVKGKGIASDKNEVYVVDAEKRVKHFGPAHKRAIANKILDLLK